MKININFIIRSVLSLLVFYALFYSLLVAIVPLAAILGFLGAKAEVAWLISFGLVGLFCAAILRPFILSPIFLALSIEPADLSYQLKFKEGLINAVLIIALFWYQAYDVIRFFVDFDKLTF